jgi:ribitol-5-phosphate 2-dehydrogenase (NADP+) / D-ribitol-5-phosphate cytidylyltransferase
MMTPSLWITGIILAAGEGRRFGDRLPKQFHLLSGKKLYLYTLEVFLKLHEFQEIILVAPLLWHESILQDLKSYQNRSIKLVAGGVTRQQSSYLGLKACSPHTSHVVIHDAVRPFVSESIIRENIRLAVEHGACDTCMPSYDTIVHSHDQCTIQTIPPRHEYLRGQTPQSFRYSLLLEAHEEAVGQGCSEATDDCQLVMRMHHPIKIALGSDENIKITTQLDLLLAEQLLRLKLFALSEQMSSSLQGKVFALTGATGGIGQEIAQLLTSQGATVLPISRTSPYSVDLTSESSVQNLFKALDQEYGALDGLINAIGYLKVGPLENLSSEDIEKLIRTNFTSIVYTCKYCSLKPGGHIVNLASTSYIRGRASYAIYSGMKAAIVNFTQGLALERTHLMINSIVPPRTNTAMRRLNFPDDEPALLLHPKAVAEEILKILLTNNLTGMVIEIKK